MPVEKVKGNLSKYKQELKPRTEKTEKIKEGNIRQQSFYMDRRSSKRWRKKVLVKKHDKIDYIGKIYILEFNISFSNYCEFDTTKKTFFFLTKCAHCPHIFELFIYSYDTYKYVFLHRFLNMFTYFFFYMTKYGLQFRSL